MEHQLLHRATRLLWTFLCLLSLEQGAGLVSAANDVNAIPLRTHYLRPPYLDTDISNRWWDFGGDTVIRTDQYVRLSAERPSQQGWVFSRVPLTATNWQVDVDFKITGKDHLYGDGMAIWFTKQRATIGPVFGSADKFEGLGIFIDTYKNNRPGVVFPYVMAMLGDGQTSYDQGNDGLANELAGCSARGIRNTEHPAHIRITSYAEGNLTVDIRTKSTNDEDFEPCFSVKSPDMPSVSYVGFSAETGELSENHDIIGVETKNLYSTPEKGSSSTSSSRGGGGSARNPDAQRSGWGWTFIKLVLFIVVGAGAYVGFTIYRSHAREKRSRF